MQNPAAKVAMRTACRRLRHFVDSPAAPVLFLHVRQNNGVHKLLYKGGFSETVSAYYSYPVAPVHFYVNDRKRFVVAYFQLFYRKNVLYSRVLRLEKGMKGSCVVSLRRLDRLHTLKLL